VYATELQPDYDADWAGAHAGAVERKPSLSFQSKTVNSPQLLVAALPETAREGGPQFGAAATVAPPVAPPTSRDDATTDPAPGTRTPFWTPADAAPVMPKGVDAQMPWRSLATLLVLAILAGAAYFAYPRAHAWYIGRSVPEDLRAYVGGKGVDHAPVGEGYSVRLPKQPAHTDAALSPDDAPWTAIHRSVVAGRDYRIVIRVAQLSGAVTLPFGLVGVLVDARVAGDVAATNLRQITFAGGPAYDYDGVTKEPFRGRVFRYGSRVYVVTVQAKGADRVFDELMRSFSVVE
jgi:hypothetical protein